MLFGVCFCLFVAAFHQTRLDTWSKARRPIKVGIKGRGRSETSRDSNPAGLCCSSAHLVQCEPDEASSFTNPNVGPDTYFGVCFCRVCLRANFYATEICIRCRPCLYIFRSLLFYIFSIFADNSNFRLMGRIRPAVMSWAVQVGCVLSLEIPLAWGGRPPKL